MRRRRKGGERLEGKTCWGEGVREEGGEEEEKERKKKKEKNLK